MAEQLDAIIIGTGQAGKPLAGALAQAGWKTAIIKRDRVGGTCVSAFFRPRGEASLSSDPVEKS